MAATDRLKQKSSVRSELVIGLVFPLGSSDPGGNFFFEDRPMVCTWVCVVALSILTKATKEASCLITREEGVF